MGGDNYQNPEDSIFSLIGFGLVVGVASALIVAAVSVPIILILEATVGLPG